MNGGAAQVRRSPLLWFAIACCLTFLPFLPGGTKPSPGSGTFARLPVMANGRLQPIDSVARNSLLILSGKQTFRDKKNPDDEGRLVSANEWLQDVLMRPEVAESYKVFLINNEDVLHLASYKSADGKLYSFAQLKPAIDEIERQAGLAETVESGERSLFQRDILKLHEQLVLYHRLENSVQAEGALPLQEEIAAFQAAIDPGLVAIHKRAANEAFSKEDLDALVDFTKRYDLFARLAYLSLVPPAKGSDAHAPFATIGENLLDSIMSRKLSPAILELADIRTAYRAPDHSGFEEQCAKYRDWLTRNYSGSLKKIDYEFVFNRIAPFYRCVFLYVLVLVLACFSWLIWPDSLGKVAYYLTALTFTIHTLGLLSRIYLQDRPPVTNLYSSAVFVGWGAVFLAIIIERIYRNGIGSATAGMIGFLTLIIAHHLSASGDTMEAMRAVLNSNLWLSTHVVVITLGYASTFLAGFLAIIYVARGILTTGLTPAIAKSLERMVYGIICFATLFSFVGTILGGIWADQSWGRFWGWDPKENGALLIVLWNAVILHTRWGGFIKQRGLMTMALFGNVVTSLSWFGVNMLGVGLHSYGFIDRAFFWLALFIASQLALICLANIPLGMWRSFATNTGKPGLVGQRPPVPGFAASET